jgi:hypothetical protein
MLDEIAAAIVVAGAAGIAVWKLLKKASEPKVASGRVIRDLVGAPRVRAPFLPLSANSLADRKVESVSVTASAPKQVFVGNVFTVAVAIHNPNRPPKTIATDDSNCWVKQADGHIRRDPQKPIVNYQVSLTADRCKIIGEKDYFFPLEVNHETKECYFDLRPLFEGDVIVTVTAQQVLPTSPRELAAQTSLKLTAVTKVISSVGAQPRHRTDEDLVGELYAELTSEKFTLNDIESIAFKMNIQWGALEGNTQDAKARSLIRYCRGRDRLKELADQVVSMGN